MNAQQLKNSILQLAISGKLVPQDPNDEPASELLCKIRAEKDRLIAEGKIKKSKKSTDKAPYTAIEPPFDIPESWEWVRLEQLGEIIGGGTPSTTDNKNWENGSISWLTPADMKFISGKYVSNGERKITEKGLNSSSARILSENSIVYSSRAPIGYIAITQNKLCTNQGFKSVDLYEKEIVDYLYYSLISLTPEIQSRSSGTTFKEISGTEFGKTLIPIPPLNEQHRIVAKIEELLPFIEQYDKQEQALKTLNKNFPEQLKKSILQAAIQGKLTEQLPTDEPASELLKRIEAEKVRLIAQGKLKKPRVRDNSQNEKFDPPFEIPQGWEWVKLEQLGEIIGGGTPSTTDNKNWENGCIPWLTPADMKFISGKYVSNGERKITEKGLNSSSARILSENSIVYSSRAPIGYIAITQNKLCTNQGFKSIDLYEKETVDYLYYSLISLTPEIQSRASGTTFKEISGTEFGKTLTPLPPLEEQKRIVEKVELLLSQIERL